MSSPAATPWPRRAGWYAAPLQEAGVIQTTGSIMEGLKVGDRAVHSRTFTEADVALFGSFSGDLNPYHFDAGFAARTRFGRPIVHGLLVGAMATHVGGQWAFLATSIQFDFLAPVYPGDTVTLEAVVESVDERGRVTVRTRWVNQAGAEVARGSFGGFPPRAQEREWLTRRPAGPA
jgi:3-hydroxybutyryl-CoA dehydratase